MRSALLIMLSSLYLSCATELHELFRIPLLLEHFREHRQEDPSLTLFEFLVIHYSGNHPADNDDGDDEQLPFKSDFGINHLDIQPASIREQAEKVTLLPLPVTHTLHPAGDLSRRSFAVFHPPRMA